MVRAGPRPGVAREMQLNSAQQKGCPRGTVIIVALTFFSDPEGALTESRLRLSLVVFRLIGNASMGNSKKKTALSKLSGTQFAALMNGEQSARELGVENVCFSLETWRTLGDLVPKAKSIGLEPSRTIDDAYAQALVCLGFTLPPLASYVGYIASLRVKLSRKDAAQRKSRKGDGRCEDLRDLLQSYAPRDPSTIEQRASSTGEPDEEDGEAPETEQQGARVPLDGLDPNSARVETPSRSNRGGSAGPSHSTPPDVAERLRAGLRKKSRSLREKENEIQELKRASGEELRRVLDAVDTTYIVINTGQQTGDASANETHSPLRGDSAVVSTSAVENTRAKSRKKDRQIKEVESQVEQLKRDKKLQEQNVRDAMAAIEEREVRGSDHFLSEAIVPSSLWSF